MSALRREIEAQARLAGPVVFVNLSMMTLGVVDTKMAGDVSTTAQAAIGLGHAWVWCLLAFGMGVVMALDPLVAQARGAGDEDGAARALQRGLVLALLLSLPLGLGLQLLQPVVDLLARFGLEQPAAVVPPASGYSSVSAWGLPAMLGFLALRQTLQAMGHLRAIVVVALAANLVNVVGNGALMNGWWGLPALGAVGCAWSTVIVEWFMIAALLVLSWPRMGALLLPLRPRALRLTPLLRMLRLGVPIGIAISLEVAAFNSVQFLMGDFGEAVMAGHRTALVIASMSYMVPLGISTAAAVRVAHAVGAEDRDAARRAARVAISAGALVMAGFGLTFLLFPGPLARAFSADPEVIAVAMSLLPLAAAFQLFDGLQCVAGGVLRGTADTAWPSVFNFVGYWILGLPLGAYWAFAGDGGPEALWWGLAGGLAFVALALLARTALRLAGPMARFDAEGLPEPESRQ